LVRLDRDLPSAPTCVSRRAARKACQGPATPPPSADTRRPSPTLPLVRPRRSGAGPWQAWARRRPWTPVGTAPCGCRRRHRASVSTRGRGDSRPHPSSAGSAWSQPPPATSSSPL